MAEAQRLLLVDDLDFSFATDLPESPPTIMAYQPPKYVRDMHKAPRFGHSNRIGNLVSSKQEDAFDYMGGLKQFTLFITVPFIMWAIILVLFKFLYGIDKVGCAAGGEVLDMKELKKEGVSRKERKRRILRSWRLQTTFLVMSILIPTTSLLMMQTGWGKIQVAWEEVQIIVDDAEALAFRGWNLLENLQTSKKNLYQNRLVDEILANSSTPETRESMLSSWCPNAGKEETLSFLSEALASVEENTETVLELFDDYVPQNVNGFMAVTEATKSVDDSIQWFFDHDWVWKMYLMVLNVLNFFMILACYILSKNNIVHQPTRLYLTFLVVPLFSVAAFLLLMVTASSGVATLLNADFCAGGDGMGSPQGSIQDAILSFQYGSLDRQNEATGTLSLVYETFNYYANGCLSDNPLDFLTVYSDRVDEVSLYLTQLASAMPQTADGIEILNAQCGADISFLPDTLDGLEKEISMVQRNMVSLAELTSCQSVSPLVRRLTHGAVCSESAHGLTWIWACSLLICVFCFVMLTTRASLYNAIKKRKPRNKKSKRAVRKEFEEYKQFMADYYDDVDQWDLVPPQKKVVGKGCEPGIPSNPTFETEDTSKSSMDERHDEPMSHFVNDQNDEDIDLEGNNSVQAPTIRIEVIHEDEASEKEEDTTSYDSSYESESDESNKEAEDDDDNDSQSAMTSFFEETKSIFLETKSILSETKSLASQLASKTLQKLKSVKPLLGRNRAEIEQEESVEDDEFLFRQPSPELRNRRRSSVGSSKHNMLVTPPSMSESLFGTGRLDAKTPPAPQKHFSFISRTGITGAAGSELEPLTTPSREGQPSPSSASGVHPRRLRLSPFQASPQKKRSKSRSKNRPSPVHFGVGINQYPSASNRPQSRSRSGRQSTEKPPSRQMPASHNSRPDSRGRYVESVRKLYEKTSTSRGPLQRPSGNVSSRIVRDSKNPNGYEFRSQRRRLPSEDSDDMSMYLEDNAPQPNTNAHQRSRRSSKESESRLWYT